MSKEELEKEAEEYAQGLGAKDFIAKPKEIVAYFGYLAGAEPREKRIAELERALSAMEKGTCDICKVKDAEFYEKRIAELEAKNKWYSEQVFNKECAEVWGNLTNAKEIIKKLKALYFSPVVTKDDVKRQDEILAEAEQFLSEVEK